MILEVANIHIPAGAHLEFEAAIQLGLETTLAKSPGFQSFEVRRCIETADRYLLLIQWETLEDHTVGFRESDLYAEWSAIVRPYFARPPEVEHFELVTSSIPLKH
ncbi:antibiotic biosynthesis monooxygenase family protein [Arthrobacter sp. 31Y]|uniref:antibiotic biosynthesis monooxygenase family protein n=1 Tax=Arthrobacter sp. 31Y TaxID=1115632 RepID=UPI000465CEF2|nr:antibiotic biosynthesis monooxygenase [Arthrobacter sp. 31Y]